MVNKCSIHFSLSVVYDYLRPHELQHARLPCSLLPGASVRNSAHGKGHEEGGLAYAKA